VASFIAKVSHTVQHSPKYCSLSLSVLWWWHEMDLIK